LFEQTFKNIDDILHKDAGCGSELDYVEQTSWVLFLKYLDDLERDKATEAEFSCKTYTPIIAPDYQWTVWAAPKLANGAIDHNALTGDDLADFVNIQLFGSSDFGVINKILKKQYDMPINHLADYKIITTFSFL